MAQIDWRVDKPLLANHSFQTNGCLVVEEKAYPSVRRFLLPSYPIPNSFTMATAVKMKLLHSHSASANSHVPSFSPLVTHTTTIISHAFPNLRLRSGHSHPNPTMVAKAALDKNSLVPSDDAEDGVLLGTMKLPSDTDLPRFQILLFQVQLPIHC